MCSIQVQVLVLEYNLFAKRNEAEVSLESMGPVRTCTSTVVCVSLPAAPIREMRVVNSSPGTYGTLYSRCVHSTIAVVKRSRGILLRIGT